MFQQCIKKNKYSFYKRVLLIITSNFNLTTKNVINCLLSKTCMTFDNTGFHKVETKTLHRHFEFCSLNLRNIKLIGPRGDRTHDLRVISTTL